MDGGTQQANPLLLPWQHRGLAWGQPTRWGAATQPASSVALPGLPRTPVPRHHPQTHHALTSQAMVSVRFALISATLQIRFAVGIPLCHCTADAFVPFLEEGGVLRAHSSHPSVLPKTPPDETHVGKSALYQRTRQREATAAPRCSSPFPSQEQPGKHRLPEKRTSEEGERRVHPCPRFLGARGSWKLPARAGRCLRSSAGLGEVRGLARLLGAEMSVFALFLFRRVSHSHSSASLVANPSPSP